MNPLIQILTEPLRATKRGVEATSKCKRCKGACCERTPGATFPEDFRRPIAEHVVRAIRSGFWMLDVRGYDDGRLVFIPRPACIWPKGIMNGVVLGGPSHDRLHRNPEKRMCVFLKSDGCMLPFEYRPKECRMLDPRGCRGRGGERRRVQAIWAGDAKKAWEPFVRAILDALMIDIISFVELSGKGIDL